MSPSGIEFDPDAAWLWLHLNEGGRVRRMAGPALVRLYLYERGLVRIEIRFLSADSGSGDAADSELTMTTN
ncbi:hypothetical protein HUO13_27445 [Saccharopolyspora erythraea]|uniref:hypothetical protein n=1 Tax=Saccharopolyspora erythraea TaxID=1836 RepID=UPI001BA7E51A|nr:hypothetical protein [Saccharopolyspora erythraea]QUH04054.1 hypothetical protein HUO13_27445 [Saccharopolyspora erythraea]